MNPTSTVSSNVTTGEVATPATAAPGEAVAIPTDVGLLALLRAVSSDTTIRDRFRTPATFDAVIQQFRVDAASRDLILALGVNDPATMQSPRTVPDKALYLQLLEKLYDQQLGKNEHFIFMW